MKSRTRSGDHSKAGPALDRRRMLMLSASALGGVITMLQARRGWSAAAEVNIELFSASGKSLGVMTLAKVTKTDVEWRQQLPEDSYTVTRHAGTEPAFTGRYANNHADGLYRCICCDTALYDSRTKFESGTGWPSFWQPISKVNVVESADRSYGMERDAISCARCDAHLGHVFDDGPKPTGLRYCMNSVALKFVPRG